MRKGKKNKPFSFERAFADLMGPIIVQAKEVPPVPRTGRVLPDVRTPPSTVPAQKAGDIHDWSSAEPVNGKVPVFNPEPKRRRAASGPRYFFSGAPVRSRTLRTGGKKRWGK